MSDIACAVSRSTTLSRGPLFSSIEFWPFGNFILNLCFGMVQTINSSSFTSVVETLSCVLFVVMIRLLIGAMVSLYDLCLHRAFVCLHTPLYGVSRCNLCSSRYCNHA